MSVYDVHARLLRESCLQAGPPGLNGLPGATGVQGEASYVFRKRMRECACTYCTLDCAGPHGLTGEPGPMGPMVRMHARRCFLRLPRLEHFLSFVGFVCLWRGALFTHDLRPQGPAGNAGQNGVAGTAGVPGVGGAPGAVHPCSPPCVQDRNESNSPGIPSSSTESLLAQDS